jgi:hypothetical protein
VTAYFSWLEIDENVVLSFVPRPLTTEMIAIEMPAAISPYSMAVAPDSSPRNALSFITSMRKFMRDADKSIVKATTEKAVNEGFWSGDFVVVLNNMRLVTLYVGGPAAHYALLFVIREAHSWPSLVPTEAYI